MNVSKFLAAAVLFLALCFLSGCASAPVSRQAWQQLHEELLDRKFLVATAQRVDQVTATTNQQAFTLTLTGELGQRGEWSSASPISGDGFLLTAKHSVQLVLEDPRLKPWVVEVDRGRHPRAFPAAVVWTGTNSDLALLKVQAEPWKYFEWSPPHATLNKGTVVLQGGVKSHMATGKTRANTLLDVPELESVSIPHSVRARPGDSGGPLIDQEGRLLGIMTRRIYFQFGTERNVVGGGEAVRPNLDLLNQVIDRYRRGCVR